MILLYLVHKAASPLDKAVPQQREWHFVEWFLAAVGAVEAVWAVWAVEALWAVWAVEAVWATLGFSVSPPQHQQALPHSAIKLNCSGSILVETANKLVETLHFSSFFSLTASISDYLQPYPVGINSDYQ